MRLAASYRAARRNQVLRIDRGVWRGAEIAVRNARPKGRGNATRKTAFIRKATPKSLSRTKVARPVARRAARST